MCGHEDTHTTHYHPRHLEEESEEALETKQRITNFEIEEDLFLVEFGDGRDKKKVMEMCPWSYEKQLILMQKFEGEMVPKEIKLQWVPFWVQMFNLPPKSVIREAEYEIGSKLGKVIDVDVAEKRVQWGKF